MLLNVLAVSNCHSSFQGFPSRFLDLSQTGNKSLQTAMIHRPQRECFRLCVFEIPSLQSLWEAQEICWEGVSPPPPLQCLVKVGSWSVCVNGLPRCWTVLTANNSSALRSLSKDPVCSSRLAWHLDGKGSWVAILSRVIKPRKISWLAVKPHNNKKTNKQNPQQDSKC